MVAAAMIQSGLLQTPRVQSPSFTSRRPARSACKSVCRASNHQVKAIDDTPVMQIVSSTAKYVCVQVIKPIKTASGVAAFVLSAAAAMQLIASPPAGIPNAMLLHLLRALSLSLALDKPIT